MTRSVSRSPSREDGGSPMEGSPKRSRRGGSVSSRSPSPGRKSGDDSEERKKSSDEGKAVKAEPREESNDTSTTTATAKENEKGDSDKSKEDSSRKRSRSPPFRRSSRSSEKDRPRTRSKTGSPADRKTRSRTGSPRSRSSSRDRSRRRDRSFSPARRDRRNSYSRNRSPIDEDGYRIHVADLDVSASKRDMEKVFGKFGPLKEIWMARSVPCFAFCVFRYREDAEDAVRSADGVEISGRRIRVTHARPRTKGRGRRGFNPNMRCYQCGDRGHFSRDCPDTKYGYKRPPSPRYSSRRDSDRHYDRGGGYDRFDNRRSSRY